MLAATDPTIHRCHCLICCGSYNTASGYRLFSSSEDLSASVNCNPENADDTDTHGVDGFPVSLFIFKKLLEIPEDVLTNLIHLHPEDSRIKAQLCKQCNAVVLQAVAIYKELLELTNRFREIQKQVLRVVRESFHSSDGDPNEINYDLGDDCRKFAVLKGIARDEVHHLEGSFAVEKILPVDVITVLIKNEIEEESGSDGFRTSVESPVWNCSSNYNPDSDDEQDCSRTIPVFSSSSHNQIGEEDKSGPGSNVIIRDDSEQDQELHYIDDDNIEEKSEIKKRKFVVKQKRPSSATGPTDVPLQKRKRGRPRKLSNTDVAFYTRKAVREKDNNEDDIDAKSDPPHKRDRGRPRKLNNIDVASEANKDTHEVQVDNSVVDVGATTTVKTSSIEQRGKRNRGNPKKLSSNTDVSSNARKEIHEVEEHNNEDDGDAKLKAELPFCDETTMVKASSTDPRAKRNRQIPKKPNSNTDIFSDDITKIRVLVEGNNEDDDDTKPKVPTSDPPQKRKRGRPRKPKIIKKRIKSKQVYQPFLTKYQDCKANPTTGKFHCLEEGCEIRYPRKYQLLVHVQHYHYGEKCYKCEVPGCGKSFVKRDSLLSHQHRHSGTPLYKCKDCPATFYARNPFIRHQEQVHLNGDINKPFICELCGRSFSCRDYLYTHRQLKHPANLQKRVSRKSDNSNNDSRVNGNNDSRVNSNNDSRVNSNNDSRVNSNNDSRVVCDICGISLKNNMILKSHLKYFHEKKPGNFICSHCPRRFHARCVLTQHLFAEHDVGEGYKTWNKNNKTLYQCSVVGCKAKFYISESLEKHRLAFHGENGDKPPAFQCQFCDKRFHQRSKLNIHETIHRNIVAKPFTCDICSNGFPTKDYLQYHWKYTHKLSMEELKTKRRELKRNGPLLDSATK